MRKNTLNKRGFTLAELLIVVAIIAVLAVIAIPIFSAKLESSREETDIANLRAAKAAAVTEYLNTGEAGEYVFDAVGGKLVDMDEIDTIEAYGQGTTTDGGCEDYYMYTDDSGNEVYYNTETDAKSAGYIKVSWTTDGVVSLDWIKEDGSSVTSAGSSTTPSTPVAAEGNVKLMYCMFCDDEGELDIEGDFTVTDLDMDGTFTVLDALHQACIEGCVSFESEGSGTTLVIKKLGNYDMSNYEFSEISINGDGASLYSVISDDDEVFINLTKNSSAYTKDEFIAAFNNSLPNQITIKLDGTKLSSGESVTCIRFDGTDSTIVERTAKKYTNSTNGVAYYKITSLDTKPNVYYMLSEIEYKSSNWLSLASKYPGQSASTGIADISFKDISFDSVISFVSNYNSSNAQNYLDFASQIKQAGTIELGINAAKSIALERQ